MRNYFCGCKFTLLVVVCALVLVSAGCSGKSSPSSSIQGAGGQLSATPTSVSFGSVTLNNSTTQNVRLSNTGAGNLTVSNASTSGPGFQVTGLTVPMTLTPGQTASFSVVFDPSSPGAASGSVQITAANISAPLMIALSGTGVSSAPSSHSVALSWFASTSSVVGYNVYRGSQSGGPYTLTNSGLVQGTSFSDSAVTNGQTYWYVVTAVASDGTESVHSNEATATIPTS